MTVQHVRSTRRQSWALRPVLEAAQSMDGFHRYDTALAGNVVSFPELAYLRRRSSALFLRSADPTVKSAVSAPLLQ